MMMKKRSNKDSQTPFNKALKFLSYKSRSTKEVFDYLKKHEFSESEINEAMEKLMDYKFIDDENFSEIFTRDRQLKGRSKRMISYELKRKGINKEVVEQTLDSAQEDIKTAKEYIEKRLHQFQKLEPGNKTKRIIGRLQSRGYNWDIIKEVLKSIN